MDTLPNNFADFPPGSSWLDAESNSRRMRRRVVATLVVLIVVGGLIGFGAYRWIASLDETLSPSPAVDPNAPPLVVTDMLGNQSESQNWAGYAAIEGSYTSVSATWTVPDIGLASAAGIDAAWVGIGGVTGTDLIQAGTQATVSGGGVTTWQKATSSTTNDKIEIWYGSVDQATNGVTVTAGCTGGMRMNLTEWSGLSLTVEKASAQAGTTSPASAGSITTASAKIGGLTQVDGRKPGPTRQPLRVHARS